jgi:hypothetical protein
MNNPNFMFDDINILQRAREASDNDLIQVAYRLAETHPTLFCRLLTEDLTVEYVINGTLYGSISVKIDRKQMDTLRAFKTDDKVRAIKWLRETFGIGLKEAKDVSEWLVREGHLPHKNWIGEYSVASPTLADLLSEQRKRNNSWKD